ncbi:hypothetical protein ID866_2225, partial [Astraeus odoratus]
MTLVGNIYPSPSTSPQSIVGWDVKVVLPSSQKSWIGTIGIPFEGDHIIISSEAASCLSSGTIGGAMCGALSKTRSIALSYGNVHHPTPSEWYEPANDLAVRILKYLWDHWGKDPGGIRDGEVDLYTVNIPVIPQLTTAAGIETYWAPIWRSSYGRMFKTVQDSDLDRASEERVMEAVGSLSFKWGPDLSSLIFPDPTSLPVGSDSWALGMGYATVTPLRACFAEAQSVCQWQGAPLLVLRGLSFQVRGHSPVHGPFHACTYADPVTISSAMHSSDDDGDDELEVECELTDTALPKRKAPWSPSNLHRANKTPRLGLGQPSRVDATALDNSIAAGSDDNRNNTACPSSTRPGASPTRTVKHASGKSLFLSGSSSSDELTGTLIQTVRQRRDAQTRGKDAQRGTNAAATGFARKQANNRPRVSTGSLLQYAQRKP